MIVLILALGLAGLLLVMLNLRLCRQVASLRHCYVDLADWMSRHVSDVAQVACSSCGNVMPDFLDRANAKLGLRIDRQLEILRRTSLRDLGPADMACPLKE